VVEATALQGIVDLAGPVRGQDHDRNVLGPDGAELGHGHLEVGEDLEEERLELLVGSVDLVDEEDRGALVGGVDRLEERPLEEELSPKRSWRTASRSRAPVASIVRR
jgi:hypothetical protein